MTVTIDSADYCIHYRHIVHRFLLGIPWSIPQLSSCDALYIVHPKDLIYHTLSLWHDSSIDTPLLLGSIALYSSM